MRFLLDENQSPRLAELLTESGLESVHVRDIGLLRAPDDQVMHAAATTGRVLISGDTDFGELLARSNLARPSVLLLRRQGERRATQLAALVLSNLDAVVDDLERGAIVVFDNDRIRVRELPLRPE